MADMGEYVADTMALVLWLEKRQLPSKVAALFEQALQGHGSEHYLGTGNCAG